MGGNGDGWNTTWALFILHVLKKVELEKFNFVLVNESSGSRQLLGEAVLILRTNVSIFYYYKTEGGICFTRCDLNDQFICFGKKVADTIIDFYDRLDYMKDGGFEPKYVYGF